MFELSYNVLLMSTLALLALSPFVNFIPENLASLIVVTLAILPLVGLFIDILCYFVDYDLLLSLVKLVLCLEAFCYFMPEKLAISIIIHFTVLAIVVFAFNCSIAFGIFLGAVVSSLVNFYIL